MSHNHYCDVAGHYWECNGAAIRPFTGETKPSICMCQIHRVSMEEGDHSECPIELLACPEHRDEQMRAMGYEPGYRMEQRPDDECSIFTDKDGNHIVGFCLWCNKDFYTADEIKAHNADDMAECPVFQELKDEPCMPPVLQVALENAGLFEDDKTDEET